MLSTPALYACLLRYNTMLRTAEVFHHSTLMVTGTAVTTPQLYPNFLSFQPDHRDRHSRHQAAPRRPPSALPPRTCGHGGLD
eukprot:363185-Chlamydomonas_euryale.AAC.6